MKLNKTLLLSSFVLITFGCLAQDNVFRYKRKLQGITNEGWHVLQLPPELFAHSEPDFRDLRLYSIAGSDTTEIPYLLDIKGTAVNKTELELTAINQSKQGGTLFLSFELSKGEKVNYIDLNFEQPNYFGFVKIEGSHDKTSWFEIIDRGRIFSIQNASEQYSSGVVNFPVTDYRYLRVSVQSDTPLTFRNAFFLNQEIVQGDFENIPVTWKKTDDKKSKQTIVDITFDHFRPFSTFGIAFDGNRDFYRSAQISYVTDSIKTQKGWVKNYRTVHNGYVTSFHENTFDLGFQLAKDVRLTINNHDNPPLAITGIQASGAVVEMKAMLKPADVFLFYGNRSASTPRYDIDYYKEKIPQDAARLSAGAEEALAVSEERAGAIFENKIWLWAIMGSVIVVLGFFTLKMMRNS